MIRLLIAILLVTGCGPEDEPDVCRDYWEAKCVYKIRCNPTAGSVDECVGGVFQLGGCDDITGLSIPEQTFSECLESYRTNQNCLLDSAPAECYDPFIHEGRP